jgi:2-iminobutanoate/2-iminopropanoate deaminase
MITSIRSASLWLVLLAMVTLAARADAQGAVKQVIGAPTATLSPAVRFGDLLFVSGQLGVSRQAPDSTIQGQTTLALTNLKGVLESAGTSMANVLKCTVFLVDIKDFGGMNQSYGAAFGKEPPARSTVVVAALVSAAAKVEIECVAGVPRP